MSEEHLTSQFPEKGPLDRQRGINFRAAQVVQDFYFLARTDLQGDPKALWDFYLQFTSPKREELLRSFAEGLQKDSPITFIRLVEQTVENNSKTARRDSTTVDQWQEWRQRVYREYPPLLFAGEEGANRWGQAVDVVNRVWEL